MKKINRATVAGIICAMASNPAFSQNSSPYSYFGLGGFNNVDNARNISLGNTGIALESPDYINQKNPAALANISVRNVVIEAGGLLKYNTIKSTVAEDRRFSGNFSNLGIAMGVAKNLFIGANVQPSTTTDYKIESVIPVEGSGSSYPVSYEGSGGISNLAVHAGYRINKNWSIGAKAQNYFGTVTRKETITLNADVTKLQISRNERYAGFNYGFGTQYSAYFPASRLQLTLGGIINFPAKLTSSGEKVYVENDDLTNGTTTSFSVKNTAIPLEKGVGIGLLYNDRYRFTVDYNQNDWQKISRTSTNEKYYQQNIVGTGFEILPEMRSGLTFTEQFIYRVGLNYDSGYYTVRNKKIDKLEATIGLGIPVRNTMVINFNYGYGKKGLQPGTAIRENYHSFNISISFLETWFTKRQLD